MLFGAHDPQLNSFSIRTVLRSLPSWIRTELVHGHPVLTWAWAYLVLGLAGSLGLLFEQTFSTLVGSGGGNPIWVLTAAGISVLGWALLRRLVYVHLVVERESRRSV